MTDKDIVLSVKDLNVNFYTNKRVNKVLRGVSFDVKKGTTLGIVGESGSGKSVSAKSIMGLLPELSRIESGSISYFKGEQEVRIENLNRKGKEMRLLRGKEIAMIFQDPMTALNPVYTIGYQIREMINEHLNLPKEEVEKLTIQSLRNVGISDVTRRVNEYPHQFSGGMRQRAMIAMAMSCSPRLLIADEPTTALDVTISAQIFELMNELKEKTQTAIILITHDMGVIAEMADEVAVMYVGNIVEKGDVKDLFKNPAHPYTKALLKSIPVLGKGKDQNLQPIKGSTPNPYNRPKGCQFAPRCDYATTKCHEEMPEEHFLNENHMTRCFNYKEVLDSGR